jgi:PAS domain S-box-containing protein
LDDLTNAVANFRKTGELATDYRIIRRDGEVRWLSVQGRMLAEASEHEPEFAVGVSFDITDQKRRQDALSLIVKTSKALASSLDYEATLRSVAEFAVPDLADWCSVYVLDPTGGFEIVALHHRDPRKIAWARGLLQRYPPDPNAQDGVQAVLRSGRSMLMKAVPKELYAALNEEQLEIVRELNVSSYMCVAMTMRGRVVGAIAFAAAESRRHYDEADLTIAEHLARKGATAIDNALAHQQVERERAKLETIVSAVGYGVCHLNEHGQITYLNHAGASLLGRTAEEAELQAACLFFHGPGCLQIACHLGESEIGTGFQGDVEFIVANGSRLAVEMLISPIVYKDELQGAVLVFHDIQDRLAQEQAKDDFVAFASHELRSPLTPVMGVARWLSRKAETQPGHYDDDDYEAISTLRDESERLSRIVETVLDLSRIEAGRLELRSDPVELTSAVAAEVGSLRQRHPEAQVGLELSGGTATTFTDEIRFRQVISNLLENAVKYGGRPPAVRITMHVQPSDAATITVSDNGYGISPADQRRIFERFYRSEGESVRSQQGFGIGLYLVSQIVATAAGSIRVESDPGHGSTFIIRWPLSSPIDEGEYVV